MGVLSGVFSLEGFSLSKLTAKDVTRIHFLLTMLVLVLVAMMAANFVSALIDNYLTKLTSTEVSKDKKLRKPVDDAELKRLAMYDLIVSRNIFDSDNEIPDDPSKLMSGEDAARRTNMEIELVGTIVVNDQSRSVAAIFLKQDKKVEPFVIGDVVLSRASVHRIARRKVIFKELATGDFEYVEMKLDDVPQRSGAAVAASGIKQLGDGKVLVERKELNKSLADISSLLTQARAVPHFEGGKIAGFKLLDIQPGSLYEKLGAQNGDIIKTVNGVEIKDPATAMALFQRLQTTSRLDFTINRGGQDQDFSVDIR
jgi:general secretion pathway protein C